MIEKYGVLHEQSDIIVYQTKDYSKFKHLLGNRDVKDNRVKKIMESIEEIGLMPAPILVNEKMEIVDGQGREKAIEQLHALKNLDLPIYYIIVEGAGIETCVAMNINAEKWHNIDYIRSHSVQGKQPYKFLEYLIDNYPDFNDTEIITALIKVSKPNYDLIKRGKLYFNSTQYSKAVEKLNTIRDILKECPRFEQLIKGHGPRRPFVQAMIYALDYEGVKVDRMKISVSQYLSYAGNWSEVGNAIPQLELIYNRNLNITKKVDIESQYKQEQHKKAVAAAMAKL